MTTSPTLTNKPEHCAPVPENNVITLSKQKARRNENILAYEDGQFHKTKDGIFYVTKDNNGNEKRLFICSALDVVADTRNEKSSEWGRLLEWKDRDGKTHRWAMPLEILKESGADMRGELLRLGMSIGQSNKARNLLSAYVQTWPTNKRALCVDRLGWHGSQYILPDESIGETEEITVFQNSGYLEPAYSQTGTLQDWQTHVAALAAGNSRMVFSISVAFASILANITGIESGGFHLRGSSSSGKTTALHLAASVFGHPSRYIRLWRTTANGLEGLAALHNDGLLILDELSQADPKEAGEAAYMLANGHGKTRATRTGAARKAATWRLMFLSAGEETLSGIMSRAGKKTNAGQEIRLADIDSDAGMKMGIFETLNGMASPAALALTLKDNAASYHGTAGRKWIETIVSMRAGIADHLKKQLDSTASRYAPAEASGQVIRVARRFALVAIAGELATLSGITGWETGEADKAARKCFDAWLESFGGTGNREERAIIEQVRGYIEQHGASRFEDITATEEQRIINRAGFFRDTDNGREFYVLPQAYRKELCAGFDMKTVSDVLIRQGHLIPGSSGKSAQTRKLPGLGEKARCYVIGPSLFSCETA